MGITSIGLLIIFLITYTLIALEHLFKPKEVELAPVTGEEDDEGPVLLNKATPALLAACLMWTILALVLGEEVKQEFSHHFVGISEILFFLIGAMTIVEIMDKHEGFRMITDKIKSTNRIKLYWIIGCISFILSAVLDNLTTSIAMVALLNKLIEEKEDKWTLAGLVIIAANAGGAWSPIGDVTTIMLWNGGQISALNIMSKLWLPSLVGLVIPILYLSFTTSGPIKQKMVYVGEHKKEGDESTLANWEKNTVFWLGIASLIWVPVFKHYTHLPPFMGIMQGVGIMWAFTQFIHGRHPKWKERKEMTISSALGQIDHSSILFFLGILLTVAALQTAGVLVFAGEFLDAKVGNVYGITGAIGILSAVVDNVPLVAAAMGMYPLDLYPQNHEFWVLLALCAGTGGSIFIIGSAAGIAVMGKLKMTFGWYFKKFTLPAFLGYAGCIGTFWLQNLVTVYLLK